MLNVMISTADDDLLVLPEAEARVMARQMSDDMRAVIYGNDPVTGNRVFRFEPADPFKVGDTVMLRFDAEFEADFREGVELGAVGKVIEAEGLFEDSVFVEFADEVVLECAPQWLARVDS